MKICANVLYLVCTILIYNEDNKIINYSTYLLYVSMYQLPVNSL